MAVSESTVSSRMLTESGSTDSSLFDCLTGIDFYSSFDCRLLLESRLSTSRPLCFDCSKWTRNMPCFDLRTRTVDWLGEFGSTSTYFASKTRLLQTWPFPARFCIICLQSCCPVIKCRMYVNSFKEHQLAYNHIKLCTKGDWNHNKNGWMLDIHQLQTCLFSITDMSEKDKLFFFKKGLKP